MPIIINYALLVYFGEGADVSLPVGKTIAMLVVIVLLPLALGMFIRTYAPERAKKVEGIVSIFVGIVLIALIIALLAGARERLRELLAQAGLATFLLNLMGVAIGLTSSRLFGLSPRESLAIAVELGIKNGTIALMVTLSLLHSSEMSIPAVIYSVVMYGFGACLIVMGRRLVLNPR